MGSKVDMDSDQFMESGILDDLEVSDHAMKRIDKRGIPAEAISVVIAYGRRVHVRGADVYFIGQKEASYGKVDGISFDKYVGIQVVCANDGAVLTVYRNHNLRGLKPFRRHRRNKKERTDTIPPKLLDEIVYNFNTLDVMWSDDEDDNN